MDKDLGLKTGKKETMGRVKGGKRQKDPLGVNGGKKTMDRNGNNGGDGSHDTGAKSRTTRRTTRSVATDVTQSPDKNQTISVDRIEGDVTLVDGKKGFVERDRLAKCEKT